MRAYDLAMTMVFVNCAFPIIDLMGINTLHEFSSNFWLLNIWSTPLFNIAGINVTGITALAVAMALATVVILSSNPITDRGIAMGVFALVFWGSLVTASLSLMGIILKFPKFTIF